MSSFACSLSYTIDEQTIHMEVRNGQLWCMEFDSSATMVLFLQQVKKQSIGWQSTLPQSINIQIVPYEITHAEEKTFYYQQRYHATENDDVISVREFIGQPNQVIPSLLQQSILHNRLDEPITCLSTGEFKIACLLKAFRPASKIIFFEELFAGLDAANRTLVIQFLHILKQTLQTCIIATTIRPYETSLFDRYIKIHSSNPQNQNFFYPDSLKNLFCKRSHHDFQYAFKLSNIQVKYNDRFILRNISWTVKKGEKWALRGKNGSGKSTLLSLINADHPQSYINDITLFDQPRTYGQNIWDIKENIGFFSHEFFRFFDKSKTVADTVFSIVNSHPYKPSTNLQMLDEKLSILMDYFGIPIHKKHQAVYHLSPAQQRLSILLGIVLKEAPLLILDEPYHHFDLPTIKKFNHLLDHFHNPCTLIFVSHDENDFPSCIQHHFYLS
ncbi:MAG TPA: ATP-binding cassette domain-containing protein [Bacteroidales bacterium]|nr:ATP-binding cassette domain-containing protein [Bacteroidales bacterium]